MDYQSKSKNKICVGNFALGHMKPAVIGMAAIFGFANGGHIFRIRSLAS